MVAVTIINFIDFRTKFMDPNAFLAPITEAQ